MYITQNKMLSIVNHVEFQNYTNFLLANCRNFNNQLESMRPFRDFWRWLISAEGAAARCQLAPLYYNGPDRNVFVCGGTGGYFC
jgi:hypothetical protein